MGLAASQARFLNLTARKTNIEYEGQQINQQRTTLANQSANYYNEMLTLTVPTPPSTDTYKTIVYSFTTTDGYTANISQVTGTSDNSTVVFTYQKKESQIAETTARYQIKAGTNDNYTNGTRTISKLSSDSELAKSADNIVSAINNIKGLEGDEAVTADDLYYMNVGTQAIPSYVYFTSADLAEASAEDNTIGANGYKEAEVTTFNTATYTNVTVSRDANNRLQSMTVDGTELAVTASSITDDDAYNDAYNEYTYQTYLYQQQLEEINAQTSVIQAQDKKLELRLKQLDTEQNAISTEMESVSSVIKKNTEDTFKTFA